MYTFLILPPGKKITKRDMSLPNMPDMGKLLIFSKKIFPFTWKRFSVHVRKNTTNQRQKNQSYSSIMLLSTILQSRSANPIHKNIWKFYCGSHYSCKFKGLLDEITTQNSSLDFILSTSQNPKVKAIFKKAVIFHQRWRKLRFVVVNYKPTFCSCLVSSLSAIKIFFDCK